jgi:aspartate aminotransferase-like enzyme
MVAVSERAWEVIESHQPPTYYASLRAYRKSQKGSDTPYTPNNQMMRGLRYTLQQIKKDGIENVWKRSARLAGGTRAAAQAMGLGVFAKDPVDSVTGINVPAGVDEKQWRKSLRSDYGCNVAGGQDHLDGKMIRVSHMGYVDEVDTVGLIAALEWTLAAQGHKFELGSGTTAFLKAQTLDFFRNPDRGAAAELNHSRQQRIAWRMMRALPDRGFLVRDFIIAKFIDQVL